MLTKWGGQRPTLLMMPWLSTSGGMCVTVPVVFVSTRLTTSMSRASPKSETLAQKPCGFAAHDVSSTLPAQTTLPHSAIHMCSPCRKSAIFAACATAASSGSFLELDRVQSYIYHKRSSNECAGFMRIQHKMWRWTDLS